MKAILAAIAGALFFFYCILSLSIFNSISSDVMQYYHLSPAKLGLLSSGYLYANALFLLPVGVIFDKYSTRYVMLLGMALATCGIFGIICSDLLVIVFIARCLSGIASAIVILGVIRTAIMWFSGKKVSTAIGLMISFGMLGGYASSLIYGLVMHFGNWILLLKCLGLFGIGIFAFMLLSYQENPMYKTLGTVNNIYLLKKVIVDKQNWLAGAYVGLMNLPVFLLGSLFGSSYLMQRYHFSNLLSASISAQIFIGVMIGSSLFGFWAARCKSLRLPLYTGAILAVILIGAIIGFNLSPLILRLLFLALGISISSQVIIYPLIAATNRSEVISSAQGIASTVNNLLGGVMQMLFGYIITTNYLDNGFKLAMLMLPISFVIALVITKRLRVIN